MSKTDRYLDTIKDVVLAALADQDVAVALFGSIARGEGRGASDVDIGIVPRGRWMRCRLALLREQLDELNVPYVIEVIDFSEVSDEFRQEALKDAVWWKN